MDAIYTYGGGEIIWQVFNGIAFLTKNDSLYFKSVIYLSALVGTILAVAKALPGGELGSLTKKWFIPTYVILGLLLVPKTTVDIIDEVDPTFVHDKVANVPVGIAFIASVTSSFARALTDEVENLFAPGAKTKHGLSVPTFAAKLMSEARYVRISDPTLRKNIKDFTRQCFRLPFILTNIKGLRNEAIHTNDILGFVESNAHSWLGLYWENPNGSVEFLTCKEACPRVKTAMSVEGTKGLSSLIASAYGKPEAELGTLSAKLKMMAGDVWHNIAKQTSSASKALEQQLMVNAYRESRDDKKTEFGMDRLSPELLSYSSTRIMAQQNTGFLMKASIAGSYMPMLQSVAFALLLIVGVIIIPLSLMPNGMSILLEWVKMMISVQLWPVFSAVINSIAHMAQIKASAGVLAGSTGFSIATQNGLSDAANDVACWMNSLQLSLPFLSWAFVSRSGVAVSQLMSSFSGGLEGGASKIGAETADGNLSFDNQNFRNQSMGNTQFAQQQYGATTSHSSTFDDGKIATTTDVHGQQTSNVRQDALTTNMSSNDNLSAQAAKNYNDTQTLADSQSRSLGMNISERAANTLSLVTTAANGQMTGRDINKNESSEVQKRAEDTKSLMEQYGKQHGMTAQTVAEGAVRFNTKDGILGKAVSKVLGVGVSGSFGANAMNQEQFNKFKNSDEGKRISEGVGFVTSYAEQNKASITNSTGKQASEGFSVSNDKVKTASEQLQKTYTKAESWSNVKSVAESSAFSSATNKNSAWISYVAEQQGTDPSSAVHMIEQGGGEIEKYRVGFITDQTEKMRSLVESADHVVSEKEIRGHLSGVKMDVGNEGMSRAQGMIAEEGLQSSEALQQKYDELNSDVSSQKASAQSKVSRSEGDLDVQRGKQANDHKTEHEKLNIRRLGGKALSDGLATVGLGEK